MPRRLLVLLGLLAPLAALAGLGFVYYATSANVTAERFARLRAYLDDPVAHADWQITAGTRCPGAPFIVPTDGYLGFGYGDSWRRGQRHQGFDIFGPTGLGQTPVVAAYPGHLTRLPEWKSTVIIRVPQDPLAPGRQIWTYYTHLADAAGNSFISDEFPPGTAERPVAAGTLLGYQGNFSGEAGNPTGMHLHFSIVKDDRQGRFLNELEFRNTLDPSPYLGLAGAAGADWSQPVTCAATAAAGQIYNPGHD